MTRQLKITRDQRIGLRYAMPAMTPGQTAGYITHHLQLAGRADWGAPRLPDSPSIRMVVWKGEVIASTEEELLS